MRSRLSRNAEFQSKKNLFFNAIGIIVVMFLLVKFGIPLLANVTLFVSGAKTINEKKTENKKFVATPFFDSQPDATNSAKITISGKSTQNTVVSLYVNNEKVSTAEVDDKGEFKFENIKLSNGQNSIKARAIDEDNNKSEFTPELVIFHKSEPPTLTIDSPTDGATIDKTGSPLVVSGKTDPGVKVTVNGFWAIVDGEGKFSYTTNLKEGENEIIILATDEASNTKEEKRKVTFSP